MSASECNFAVRTPTAPTPRKLLWLVLITLLLANSAPAATRYKVLYNFQGGNDAGGPLYGALALDKSGNLFGTAGSAFNCYFMKPL